MNNLRQRLRNGETIVGSWLQSNSPIIAELMAQQGFDFLTLDAEHAPLDLGPALAMLHAIAAGNPRCAPLVRLPGNDYATTKRFLDAGATGVIAPLINTAAQAREVVRATKYPPLGGRGVGFCRANAYGANVTPQTLQDANDNTFICLQIEHADALANLDDILRVGEIDAALIGPYDLSASLGLTGDFTHPRMIEAEQEILAACQRHGVAAGIHIVQPDSAALAQRRQAGYRFIAYSLDITFLMTACRQALAGSRQPPAGSQQFHQTG